MSVCTSVCVCVYCAGDITREFDFGDSTYTLHPRRAELEVEIKARVQAIYDASTHLQVKSYPPNFSSVMPHEVKRQLSAKFVNHNQQRKHLKDLTMGRYYYLSF